MTDATVSLTTPDGVTTPPVPLDQLTAAAAVVTEPLTAEVAAFVIREGKCTTSYVQRAFSIGYARALRIVERLESLNVISPADGRGARTVLATEVPDTLKAAAAAQKKAKQPMAETQADRDTKDKAFRVTASELRQFIERFERLAQEKQEISDQQKAVMAEAKARGYDTKAMRKLIAERKRDPGDVADEQAVLELYREALGM